MQIVAEKLRLADVVRVPDGSRITKIVRNGRCTCGSVARTPTRTLEVLTVGTGEEALEVLAVRSVRGEARHQSILWRRSTTANQRPSGWVSSLDYGSAVGARRPCELGRGRPGSSHLPSAAC
jgi:hypothetical protein